MGLLERTHRKDPWARTRWSVVISLDQPDDPRWEASWAYLVDAYRHVMERYVARALARAGRRGAVSDEAADVVQDFLSDCIAKGWLSRARPDRGRFRAFVQTLLRRYTYSYLRHSGAKKRTPPDGTAVLPLLSEDAIEPCSPSDEQDLREFDEGWVRVAVDRALESLRAENARHATIVCDLIAGDGTESPDLPERIEARDEQMPVLRHRARKRFVALFESELQATVDDEDAFAEEWRALRPYLP